MGNAGASARRTQPHGSCASRCVGPFDDAIDDLAHALALLASRPCPPPRRRVDAETRSCRALRAARAARYAYLRTQVPYKMGRAKADRADLARRSATTALCDRRARSEDRAYVSHRESVPVRSTSCGKARSARRGARHLPARSTGPDTRITHAAAPRLAAVAILRSRHPGSGDRCPTGHAGDANPWVPSYPFVSQRAASSRSRAFACRRPRRL